MWAAPGRVNLLGEHTDYNDGFVLPMAVGQRTVVAARRRDDGVVSVRSRVVGGSARWGLNAAPGEVTGWAAYVAGVIWTLRTAGHELPGLDLSIEGDVPLGAGLASSASLTCAVAGAVNASCGLGLARVELARVAQRAETDFVGVPCGLLDQLASLYGRAEDLLHIDVRSLDISYVPATWTSDGLTLLVIDTRVRHALADGAYGQRRRECEAAASALGVPALRDVETWDVSRLGDTVLARRAAHVVSENARVLDGVRAVRSRDWEQLGQLLTASHRSLRDDFEVSCDELDLAVGLALTSGALGARLTGAGFGGSAIALVRTESVDAVSKACVDAFAARGFAQPQTFVVEPSAGAGPV